MVCVWVCALFGLLVGVFGDWFGFDLVGLFLMVFLIMVGCLLFVWFVFYLILNLGFFVLFMWIALFFGGVLIVDGITYSLFVNTVNLVIWEFGLIVVDWLLADCWLYVVGYFCFLLCGLLVFGGFRLALCVV